MKFQDLEHFTNADVEAAITRNDPDELLHIAVGVSMSAPDLAWAQEICLRLACHPHVNVRGNAVLGFGHLARRFGQLDEERVKPIIDAALHDPSDYVRGHADSAASDVTQFLKWHVEGHAGNEKIGF